MPSFRSPTASGMTLQDLEYATSRTTRMMDLALVMRRAKTHEVLLRAGGVWDRIHRRFLTRVDGQREKPQQVCVVNVEESQVEFVRWFSLWMRALREGHPLD